MPLAVKPESLIVASRGTLFVSQPNVALPADGLKALAEAVGAAQTPEGWERVANTSRENLPTFEVEQGDTKTIGSWDVKAIRTIYEDGSVKLTFHPMQHDIDTLVRFFHGWPSEDGKGAVMGASGWAFTLGIAVVIMDGELVSGYHIPNLDAVVTGLPALSLDAFNELTVVGTAKAASATVIKPNLGRSGLLTVYPPVKITG